jgi:putative endonuclease
VIGAVLDKLRDVKRRRQLASDLATGRRGEDLAHRFLRKQGYTIVARNYRLASGEAEADLIAHEGGEAVIIEVKTRETSEYGPPERAIGPEKQRHLLRVARDYARKTNTPPDRMRIDVVTIVLPDHITLFRDVFRLPG